jgi:hypothetical protein
VSKMTDRIASGRGRNRCPSGKFVGLRPRSHDRAGPSMAHDASHPTGPVDMMVLPSDAAPERRPPDAAAPTGGMVLPDAAGEHDAWRGCRCILAKAGEAVRLSAEGVSRPPAPIPRKKSAAPAGRMSAWPAAIRRTLWGLALMARPALLLPPGWMPGRVERVCTGSGGG